MLEIWFIINQLKKYALLCKSFVRSQLAQYSWACTTQFWGFPFIFQLLLSARNLRTSRGRPKVASFSEDIYVAWNTIFISWPCRESHNIVCSTVHTCNKLQAVAKCVHPNTVVKIKKQKFFCTFLARAATSKKFAGGEVTFGNDYDVIDVQSTMMRLFCYDKLTNIGGGAFFIVGDMGVRRGAKWAFPPAANWFTNQIC